MKLLGGEATASCDALWWQAGVKVTSPSSSIPSGGTWDKMLPNSVYSQRWFLSVSAGVKCLSVRVIRWFPSYFEVLLCRIPVSVLSLSCVWLLLLPNVSHLCLIVSLFPVSFPPVPDCLVFPGSSPEYFLCKFLLFWSLFRLPTTGFAYSLTVPLLSALISWFRPQLSKTTLI